MSHLIESKKIDHRSLIYYYKFEDVHKEPNIDNHIFTIDKTISFRNWISIMDKLTEYTKGYPKEELISSEQTFQIGSHLSMITSFAKVNSNFGTTIRQIADLRSTDTFKHFVKIKIKFSSFYKRNLNKLEIEIIRLKEINSKLLEGSANNVFKVVKEEDKTLPPNDNEARDTDHNTGEQLANMCENGATEETNNENSVDMFEEPLYNSEVIEHEEYIPTNICLDNTLPNYQPTKPTEEHLLKHTYSPTPLNSTAENGNAANDASDTANGNVYCPAANGSNKSSHETYSPAESRDKIDANESPAAVYTPMNIKLSSVVLEPLSDQHILSLQKTPPRNSSPLNESPLLIPLRIRTPTPERKAKPKSRKKHRQDTPIRKHKKIENTTKKRKKGRGSDDDDEDFQKKLNKKSAINKEAPKLKRQSADLFGGSSGDEVAPCTKQLKEELPDDNTFVNRETDRSHLSRRKKDIVRINESVLACKEFNLDERSNSEDFEERTSIKPKSNYPNITMRRLVGGGGGGPPPSSSSSSTTSSSKNSPSVLQWLSKSKSKDSSDKWSSRSSKSKSAKSVENRHDKHRHKSKESKNKNKKENDTEVAGLPPKLTAAEQKAKLERLARGIELMEEMQVEMMAEENEVPNIAMLTLKEKDLDYIVETYSVHQTRLNFLYDKFIESKTFRVKKSEDITNPIMLMNYLLTKTQQLKMMEILEKEFCDKDQVLHLVDLFWGLLMPEWTLEIFMKEFFFERDDAIKRLELQFKLSNNLDNSQSLSQSFSQL